MGKATFAVNLFKKAASFGAKTGKGLVKGAGTPLKILGVSAAAAGGTFFAGKAVGSALRSVGGGAGAAAADVGQGAGEAIEGLFFGDPNSARPGGLLLPVALIAGGGLAIYALTRPRAGRRR